MARLAGAFGLLSGYVFLLRSATPSEFAPAFIWFPIVLAPLLLPSAVFSGRLPSPEERAAALVYRRTILHAAAREAGEEAVSPLKDPTARYVLACVDKFVDDAQAVLTGRARLCYVFGAFVFLASLGTLHVAGILAYHSLIKIESLFTSSKNAPALFGAAGDPFRSDARLLGSSSQRGGVRDSESSYQLG